MYIHALHSYKIIMLLRTFIELYDVYTTECNIDGADKKLKHLEEMLFA